MGDPGLKSKSVEMQQDDVTPRYVRHDQPRSSRELDVARVRQQLEMTRNPRYRRYLKKALRSLELKKA